MSTPRNRVPGEWQDISSAPKDGTRVLGRRHWADRYNGRLHYEKHKTFWGKTSHVPLYGWNWGRDPENQQIWEPTHWMPLPEPPVRRRTDRSTASRSRRICRGVWTMIETRVADAVAQYKKRTTFLALIKKLQIDGEKPGATCLRALQLLDKHNELLDVLQQTKMVLWGCLPHFRGTDREGRIVAAILKAEELTDIDRVGSSHDIRQAGES